jgi:hypothetical protein
VQGGRGSKTLSGDLSAGLAPQKLREGAAGRFSGDKAITCHKKETGPFWGPATFNEIRFMSRLEIVHTSFHSVWIPLFSSVSGIGLIIDNRHN